MRLGRKSIALLFGLLCSDLVEIVNGDEDDYNPGDEKPFQIGEHIPVQISSDDTASDIQPVIVDGAKQYTITKAGSSYISVHFANLDLHRKCAMTIADANGQQATEMLGRGRKNLGTFWGHHVEGDTMILTLSCKVENKRADFLIDGFAAGYPNDQDRKRHLRRDDRLARRTQVGAKTVCTADDKLNAKCYESSHPTEYTKAKAVARLVVNGMYGCTGWLVGPNNLLLTNYHCIKTTADAMNTDFQFMFEGASCDSDQITNSETYDALTLIKSDSVRDYSLIQLDGDAVTKYGYLDIDNRVPSVGEKIFIPQHAGARDKEIAIFDTSLDEADKRCEVKSTMTGYCRGGGAYNDVYYSCDTEGGTSGSPVISVDTGKVVALHHCGGGCNGNKGVPIAEIYDDISSYIYCNEAALIDKVGETDFLATPVTILGEDGHTVTFQVTNTFQTVANMYTTYKDSNGEYTCYGEQDLASGGSFELTASCLHHEPVSIMHLYVSYPDMIPDLDNASIHQCCHAPQDGNPVVEYTFELSCVSQCTVA